MAAPGPTEDPNQPGKMWVVLEEDNRDGLGLPIILACGGLAVVCVLVLSVYKFCRKNRGDGQEVDYNGAVTNSMYREDSLSPTRPSQSETLSMKDMKDCLNCRLIEMGEMACYTERCSACGRIPPGRKAFPSSKVHKTRPPAGRPPPQYMPQTRQYPEGEQGAGGYPDPQYQARTHHQDPRADNRVQYPHYQQSV